MENNLTEAQSPDPYGWAQLRLKVQQQRACRAFELFRRQGIEPVLIKGLAAARYYPRDVLRESIDIDLAVASADYYRAESLIKSDAFDGLAVDLHRELRHLDTVKWSTLFNRSGLVATPYGHIRMLAPEDHLRVLCVHWLNDGGTRKERLWDIYYAIANRDAEFDWQRFLGPISTKRRRWLVCTIGLVHRYLQLPVDSLPIAAEVDQIPPWLISTVERAWRNDSADEIPLWLTVRSPRMFAEQLGRRLSVNPLRATVELNGSFDGNFRIGYQLANFFQRLVPSVSRNIKGLSKND